MKTYLHSIGDANKSKVKGSVSISKQKLLSTIGTGIRWRSNHLDIAVFARNSLEIIN